VLKKIRFEIDAFINLLHAHMPLRVVVRYLWELFLTIIGRPTTDRAVAERFKAEFASATVGMEFTSDWIDTRFPHLTYFFRAFRNKAPKILEIGSFEGRSCIFFLLYMPSSTVTCLDTWGSPSELLSGEQPDFERRFDRNVSAFRDRVEKLKGLSALILPQFTYTRGPIYDIAYVDGSHYADDVMVDAILAFQLLKVGGLMVFDDYRWGKSEYPAHKNPNGAANLFLKLTKGEYEILYCFVQLVIRKTSDGRKQHDEISRYDR
jgi:predicted O-methyltransferase YrrM